MVKVIWTTPALNDVRHIIEFISHDSLIYAQSVGTKIIHSPKRLEQFPLSGRIVPEFSDESIREVIYGSYRIIYKIFKNDCFVVAVIHASRNIIRQLNPGEWDIPL